MKELFNNILNWIKNPDDIMFNISFKDQLSLALQILLLDILITIPFSGLTHLIHLYIVKLEAPLTDWNLLLTILLMVIIMPVIEEIIFRLPLKFKRNYLIRFLNWTTSYQFKKRWDSIFKYFLYLSITAFGLIHLSNFNNNELLFYALAPIIIGSQLIGGIILSYTRIKLGFIWSILQHCSFNLFIFLVVFIFYHNESITNISNNNLTLSIKELIYINKNDTYFETNSEKNLIYKIEANDISLFRLIDSLQIEGTKPYNNIWIDINMESEKGISKKELLKIIKNEIKFEN
jgi:membrane protease YdiL (CAAX protease family)